MASSVTCVKTGMGKLELREIALPDLRPEDVLVRTTLATVCGSDIHFLDEYPMPPGRDALPMGHEGLGVVAAVGSAVKTLAEGDRVVASCVYGCGRCANCQHGDLQLCTVYGKIPGITNGLAGCQGEYFLVREADLNAAKVPDELSDEAAILAGDIMSTGFGAVERGGVSIGDTVAIFAQGPVGLCATAGARIRGAGLIIAVEGIPERAALARRMGANVVVEPGTAVEEILALTNGVGVDVAIEALGRDVTFRNALATSRVGGTVSSVGVYAAHRSLDVRVDGRFYMRRIVTTVCPAGSDRLRRLFDVALHGNVDLAALFTHRRKLDEVIETYDQFKNRQDGMVKVALTTAA
jgi:alcohol dehydrogenase